MRKKRSVIVAGIIIAAMLFCGCSAGQQRAEDAPESGSSAPAVSVASEPSAMPEPTVTPESSVTPEPTATSEPSGAADNDTGQTLAPDLNRNGIAEEIRLSELDDGQGQQMEIWENGEIIKYATGNYSHAGWISLFLCTLDGEDYLLSYSPSMYQGVCSYDYRLYTLVDNTEEVVQSSSIDFDINFGSPIHTDFDPEAIAAFMEEINDLLSHSVQLLNTDADLLGTFEKEGRLYDSLWWLDTWQPVFVRDENKSLLDNLMDFQAAITADSEPIAADEADGLPITEPLEMTFYSGAGAWANTLTLNPDGSFAGEYFDDDYLTIYVCKYHGHFGKVEKLTDASWMLTLDELELDTEHSVGEEWDEPGGEDAYHYISSEPYGLEDTDGAALKPGAQFMLYSPSAVGHEPGTELYGAEQFQEWMHKRMEFNDADDILGCWGLQNMATGQGFFTETSFS